MSLSGPVVASAVRSESSFQRAPGSGETALRSVLIFAAAAYLLGLAATLPARLVLRWAGAPAETAASGTVWSGAATAAGHTASWRVAPGRSLATFSLAADVTVEGADTRLTGRASARPGALVVRDLKGVAGWPTISTLAPALPFACETRAEVDLERVELGREVCRASGTLTTGSGLCTAGGEAATVPALRAAASPDEAGTAIRVFEQARPGVPLILASVGPGGTRVAVTAAGAAVLPGGSVLSGAAFETGPVTARPGY
jgi:hypothetical protein